jgi:hypothetical protein
MEDTEFLEFLPSFLIIHNLTANVHSPLSIDLRGHQFMEVLFVGMDSSANIISKYCFFPIKQSLTSAGKHEQDQIFLPISGWGKLGTNPQ